MSSNTKKTLSLLSVLFLKLFFSAVFAAANLAFSEWKITPQANILDFTGIFNANYNTGSWVNATVPGTVFGDYVKAGLEKDPNYGDNIYNVDRSKYNRNFVYRSEFFVPANYTAEKTWLNFEGINSKGDIYLNGIKLGTLDGFMRRGKYDVGRLLQKGAVNVVAIKVYLPEEPLVNWASPTYLSSAGWDWMPYVPGLNMGITDDVYFSTSGKVTIADPWIRTNKILSSSSAQLSFQADLKNTTDTVQSGILSGVIMPGNFQFALNVRLNASETKTVSIKNQILNGIKLWWPNGYGDPNLYNLTLKFTQDNISSDSTTLAFGIRKYTYDTLAGVLHISVNGARIFLKGGNWGMSDYMLRCRGKEYDTKLRFHKEMNMNIIRNWLGSTTDNEFYDACDKYGIMVWDDFWLNNFFTALRDTSRFNSNVIEKVKRYRQHACIAMWCGDNEGTAFIEQDTVMRNAITAYDLNDRRYQPCSNQGNLSGSGFWTNFEPKQYFTGPTNFYSSTWGLRSELGTAVFTSFESFKEFIPEANWWPRNEMWNKHFFGPQAAGAGADTYQSTINTKYGTATGIQDFCRKAQLVNIETNKAMFEGWQDNIWNDASGLLIWMSQSAWPALVWQTYDYFYDCTGAYWGAKHACEPLHIQWNVADDSVKVINTTNSNANNLTAISKVYNIEGTEIPGLSSTISLNALKDTSSFCFRVFTKDNLAYHAAATATSTTGKNTPDKAFDGDPGTRWESKYSDNQSLTVDLGAATDISSITINWEAAYGKSYKIQTSLDGTTWSDVYSTTTGDGGLDEIVFGTTTNARYVKMLGVKRGTVFGYSIYEMQVFGPGKSNLSNVHFLKLQLKNAQGKVVSDNFYWRTSSGIFTDLNTLPPVNLAINSQTTVINDIYKIDAQIKNPVNSNGIAFAVRVQVVSANTGKRILPVYMNDNYFSLVKGETKNFHVEFDTSLVAPGDSPKLVIDQYADDNSSSVSSAVFPLTKNIMLQQGDAFPNPFKNNVFINVNVKQQSDVLVTIFNAGGSVVTKITKRVSAGSQLIEWNGLTNNNHPVQQGIYIALISVNGQAIKTVKLMKVE